jgi:hypothetical protein
MSKISHSRFTLSFRDVEDLLAERGKRRSSSAIGYVHGILRSEE